MTPDTAFELHYISSFSIKIIEILECPSFNISDGLSYNVITEIEEGIFVVGTRIEFSCNTDLRINNEELTINSCLDSGEWELSFPYCLSSSFC